MLGKTGGGLGGVEGTEGGGILTLAACNAKLQLVLAPYPLLGVRRT